MSVDMQQVTEFLKVLVAWGGKHTVDKEFFVCNTSDGSRVPVMINKKERNMYIPHDGMRYDPKRKDTIFMPLIEPLGHTAERTWFFNERNVQVGEIVQRCMLKLIDLCTECEDDEEPTYDQVGLAQSYTNQVDAKMIKELEKLPTLRLARIVYNRPKRIAQLQTDIYNEDYLRDKLKWRKKTITVLQSMFNDILSSEDVQEDYTYSAVEMGMPEVECFIHILAMYSNAVGTYADKLLHISLFPTELEAHLECLSAYRKKCSHLVSATIVSDKTEKEERKAGKPLSTTSLTSIPAAGGVVPGSAIPGPTPIPGMNYGSRVPQNTLGYGQIAMHAAMNPFFDMNRFMGEEPKKLIGAVSDTRIGRVSASGNPPRRPKLPSMNIPKVG